MEKQKEIDIFFGCLTPIFDAMANDRRKTARTAFLHNIVKQLEDGAYINGNIAQEDARIIIALGRYLASDSKFKQNAFTNH